MRISHEDTKARKVDQALPFYALRVAQAQIDAPGAIEIGRPGPSAGAG